MSEYGWTGKLLRVDLTSGNISTVDTSKYVPKFIGGIGMAHRIAWEEIPKGVGAFDPENLLIVSHGPLTGTIAPGSAHGTVCGIGAQQLPEMFSWSDVGGWFHTELKFAGWDGIIIKGKSAYPCYLWINDDEVEIKEAGRIWGLGTFDTQKELRFRHGPGIHSLCIGPAGENLVRFAGMHTDTENAAASGFGAVAGSKNLKAICVKGSKSVKVARPDDLWAIGKEWNTLFPPTLLPWWDSGIVTGDRRQWVKSFANIPYRRHFIATCRNCFVKPKCRTIYTDTTYETRPGFHSQEQGCIGVWGVGFHLQDIDWPLYYLSYEGGLEIAHLMNDYGLNEWLFYGGMLPWLCMAYKTGVLTEDIFGGPLQFDSTKWQAELLHSIAYREGFGDLLAEGPDRAINTLGKEKFGETMYRGLRKFQEGNPTFPQGGPQVDTPISLQMAWGFAEHGTSKGTWSNCVFPDDLPAYLNWMHLSRDPISGGHIKMTPEEAKEYREAANPYRCERIPAIAIYASLRIFLKESLTQCDSLVPKPGTPQSDIEARTFSAVTGIDTTEEELDKIAERLQAQARAVIIRGTDRNRTREWEEIEPFVRRQDSLGHTYDLDEFQYTIDNYLTQLGWDKATGWPTRAKYEELGLKDVADELEAIGKLP